MAKKDYDLTTVGGRIKKYRLERGYTQEEFAEKLGIAKSMISYYENNKVDMKNSVLEEIAVSLGVTVSLLIEEEPALNPDEMELLMLYRRLKKEKTKDAAKKSLMMLAELEE